MKNQEKHENPQNKTKIKENEHKKIIYCTVIKQKKKVILN